MYIDKQNILCISEPINSVRTYEQIVDGCKIFDYDKAIFVYHKKQIKEFQLKDLGKNMSVFCVVDREKNVSDKLDVDSFFSALSIFQGFDEETGKKYCFVPKFSPNNVDSTNQKLEKMGLDYFVENSDKGVIVENLENIEGGDFVSKLFGFAFFYGKLDLKNDDLKSVKVHIPLFGQYLSQKEVLDQEILDQQKNGLFIKTSVQENNDGLVYQITITDYEILQSFANFLKPIAKINKISKYDYVQVAINKLVEYNSDVEKLIAGKTIKLLTK